MDGPESAPRGPLSRILQPFWVYDVLGVRAQAVGFTSFAQVDSTDANGRSLCMGVAADVIATPMDLA
jgi:hypothetical protein